jgi:hypothetical protein
MDSYPRIFPFGRSVTQVKQLPDGVKKRAFVLGIYSSAVHARWIGHDGAVRVAAIAVASEPYIFWRGEDATRHIPVIDERLGRLEAAAPGNNGPSGIALDKRYLNPLGLSRHDVWLSDLVPNTLLNRGQQLAVERYYHPIAQQFDLPICTVQPVPPTRAAWEPLISIDRLIEELRESQADIIITLGNLVIKHFLNNVCEREFPQLAIDGYGRRHVAAIDGRTYCIICLAHMRVTTIRPISRWQAAHDDWTERAL